MKRGRRTDVAERQSNGSAATVERHNQRAVRFAEG
jgi:hypothetical protein